MRACQAQGLLFLLERYSLTARLRLRLRPARARRRGCATSRCAAAPPPSQRDVLVVGGGAAGLTAAYFAAKAGARVAILERNAECGKKILMSGGTRANVLPLAVDTDADFFTGGSRNALKRVLASWPLDDVRTWLSRDVGIELALEEDTGKWFPAANSGRAVRDMLLAAAIRRGATVHHRASVEAVRREGGRWAVTLADGSERSGDALVLATGGLSFPLVGTTGTGHKIAEQSLGHTVETPFPALVPLLGSHPGAELGGGNSLAGVSLQTVALRAGAGSKAARAHRGGFLFSHKGFSGPAVLDLSHRLVTAAKDAAPPLLADWTGEGRAAWEARLAAPGPQLVASRLAAHLPARLAAALCAAAAVPADRRAAELRKDERTRLLDALASFPLRVTGDAGFAKAEVSGGGVPLSELRLDTLESRKAPGVFICGELVDAFGRIGGFNFLLAWCTGRLAGMGAAAGGNLEQVPEHAASKGAQNGGT